VGIVENANGNNVKRFP